MKRVGNETKQIIINQFNNGISVASLTETTGIPRSTIYGWLKASHNNSSSKRNPSTKREYWISRVPLHD